ncbi:hypothetical protein OAK75_05920 [Bacteriovoracales bacterium]|nr:hypothetical protein [Bacteriovoracales bacterium]
MKNLEKYLSKLKVNQIRLGVACNTSEEIGLRYWDESGEHVSIDEIPPGFEEGIFFFIYKNGKVTLIKN